MPAPSSTSPAAGQRCSGTRTARRRCGSTRSKCSTHSPSRSASKDTRWRSTAATSWRRSRSAPNPPRSCTRTRRSRSGRSMFAPLDEPGLVILLDVDSRLPIAVTASFRPRLRLMWPATSMTANLGWDENAHVYYLTEETGRHAAVIGCPLGRDVSVMPYQEEPRDMPNRFVIRGSTRRARRSRAARHRGEPRRSRRGEDRVRPHPVVGTRRCTIGPRITTSSWIATRCSIRHRTRDSTTAFRWAKIGIDKGLATNPQLGTGLLAGFRPPATASAPVRVVLRPRCAMDLAGDHVGRRFRRRRAPRSNSCGSINGPTERFRTRSRSRRRLVPWFDQFPYAWASADATPLYRHRARRLLSRRRRPAIFCAGRGRRS